MIKKIKILCRVFIVVLSLIILLLLVRIFLADTFAIPSESMVPTLIPGDIILVDKMTFGARIYKNYKFSKYGNQLESFRFSGLRKIVPGDVVVFNMPNNGNVIRFVINYVFCKRCVGCPGDIVIYKSNRIENNNANKLLSNKVKKLNPFFNFSLDGVIINDNNVALSSQPYSNIPLYVPRKGDLVRITPNIANLYNLIIEQETRKKIHYSVERNEVWLGKKVIYKYYFTHNYYLMAGDNSTNSYDSRYWGFVPEEYIIGVASKIVFSWDNYLKEIRWNRILKDIK